MLKLLFLTLYIYLFELIKPGNNTAGMFVEQHWLNVGPTSLTLWQWEANWNGF